MGGRAGADELCDEEEQIDGEVSSVDPCGGCGGGAVEEAGRARIMGISDTGRFLIGKVEWRRRRLFGKKK